jgi:hypothetical protein
MSSRSTRSLADQINAARLAISNTLSDPEIQHMVARYGYTLDKLAEGQRLYDTAIANVNAQASASAEQRLATARLRAAEAAARASYQALAQLARAVLPPGNGHRLALGLVGAAPQGTPAFLKAGDTLFANALNVVEIKALLAEYGYDEARFEAERAQIEAFERAYKAQVAARGAAQHATRAHHATFTSLKRWVAQYLKIAKIALRDKPELIEKLGGTNRSAKTEAQRNAPRKAAATRALRQAA